MGDIVFESTTGTQEAAQNANMPSGGQLYVPPAYIQIDASQASLQLNSATCKAAFAFTPEIDIALSSMSFYINAVGTTGNIQIDLCAEDGTTAIHTNGDLNGSATNAAPTMTANNLPAPRVVAIVDSAEANAETAGFEAFKAMDGAVTADNGVRSNAAPTAPNPIYWCLDLGVGNSAVYNKFRFVSFSNASADIRAFPKAFTFWGSNVAAPTKNTDADWTALTNAQGTTWTAETDPGTGAIREYTVNNGTAYRHYRIKFTDRNGVNAYVALGEIRVIAAQSKPIPGAVLQALGTKAVGAAPGWVRHTWAAYQLQRNKRYWVQFTGAAAKDFSLAVRRWNTATGSMFPDSVMASDSGIAVKQTTDGALWTGSLQNAKPAMLNVVLNSTANHSPQLYYGRGKGQSDYLPGVGTVTIPATGCVLDCEALTASTLYYVYVYDNSGTLTLEASATNRVISEGIEVKSGATTHRFVGLAYPITRQAGFQAPIDVMDRRLVASQARKITQIGKPNPYSTSTALTNILALGVWNNWMLNDDWRIEFLVLRGLLHLRVNASNQTHNMGIAIDGSREPHYLCEVLMPSGSHAMCPIELKGALIEEGFHYAYPVYHNDFTPTVTGFVYRDIASSPTSQRIRAQFGGSVTRAGE